MRVFALLFCTIAAGLVGCTQTDRHARQQTPRYLVPSTAMVQSSYRNDQPLPSQVLPSSDALYDIPRSERFAYGDARPDYYSYIYTYDYQQIGIRNSGGFGYRYRHIVHPVP